MHAHLQRKSTCWSAELCIPLHLTRHRSLADVLIQIVPNVVSSPVLIQCEVSDFKQLPQRALAAPRDHRQLHLFQQLSLSLRVCSTVSCHSWAKANSTKELRLYSTRKRNYKPHVPEERVNAQCYLPKTWKMTGICMIPCTGTPQAMEGIQPLWDHPCEYLIWEAASLPQCTNSATLLTTMLFGFLTGKKGGERQLSYLHMQTEEKQRF